MIVTIQYFMTLCIVSPDEGSVRVETGCVTVYTQSRKMGKCIVYFIFVLTDIQGDSGGVTATYGAHF
jgi:hypothetical protein